MKPWMKYSLMLLSAITGLVMAVGTLLTAMQGQDNKVNALRSYDNERRAHRFSSRAPYPRLDEVFPETLDTFGRKTDMAVIAESAQAAADRKVDDTAYVTLQPTTAERWLLRKKSRSVSLRSLRPRTRK